MSVLMLMAACFLGYGVAYHTYGRFLARRIFRLDAGARVPSHERRDGIDFVPTRRGIVFGHHFTSIAGTGPIRSEERRGGKDCRYRWGPDQ